MCGGHINLYFPITLRPAHGLWRDQSYGGICWAGRQCQCGPTPGSLGPTASVSVTVEQSMRDASAWGPAYVIHSITFLETWRLFRAWTPRLTGLPNWPEDPNASKSRSLHGLSVSSLLYVYDWNREEAATVTGAHYRLTAHSELVWGSSDRVLFLSVITSFLAG